MAYPTDKGLEGNRKVRDNDVWSRQMWMDIWE